MCFGSGERPSVYGWMLPTSSYERWLPTRLAPPVVAKAGPRTGSLRSDGLRLDLAVEVAACSAASRDGPAAAADVLVELVGRLERLRGVAQAARATTLEELVERAGLAARRP